MKSFLVEPAVFEKIKSGKQNAFIQFGFVVESFDIGPVRFVSQGDNNEFVVVNVHTAAIKRLYTVVDYEAAKAGFKDFSEMFTLMQTQKPNASGDNVITYVEWTPLGDD